MVSDIDSEKSCYELRNVRFLAKNGTRNSGLFCRFKFKMVGLDVDFDLGCLERVAEHDQKIDPHFFLQFWQLEKVQARVLDETIRTIDAS